MAQCTHLEQMSLWKGVCMYELEVRRLMAKWSKGWTTSNEQSVVTGRHFTLDRLHNHILLRPKSIGVTGHSHTCDRFALVHGAVKLSIRVNASMDALAAGYGGRYGEEDTRRQLRVAHNVQHLL